MLILQENVQLLTVKFWSSDIFFNRSKNSENSSSSQVGNIRYFVFNLICFIIKSCSCSSVSNTRYFVLTSFIVALRVALVAKLIISGILSSISLILALYTSFLTTLFLLYHLVYLNQQEQLLIYQHQIYLLYFSNCLNYLVYLINLSIYYSSASDFKLAKSFFKQILMYQHLFHLNKSAFVA